MGRLSLGLGLGVGYVLGARAGRARYEQISKAAAGFVQRPAVQQALGRAKDAAPAPLRGGIDALTGGAPASGGSGGGTSNGAGGGTAPAAAAAARAGGDSPVPDPLVPPAKTS